MLTSSCVILKKTVYGTSRTIPVVVSRSSIRDQHCPVKHTLPSICGRSQRNLGTKTASVINYDVQDKWKEC